MLALLVLPAPLLSLVPLHPVFRRTFRYTMVRTRRNSCREMILGSDGSPKTLAEHLQRAQKTELL